MAGATILWYDLVEEHDSDADALRAELQQLLKAKQVNAARMAHLQGFVGLEKSNVNLIHRLKIEKNLKGPLEREAARLSTRLETEIKKIKSLSKQAVEISPSIYEDQKPPDPVEICPLHL
ncbi:Hypothetical protein SMAX5B_005291 [Scophthalmus maximus]|uniref:Uncharacterized protein n=1 Tax=Scophthalmus maximus TaxID=52904 RepID=A0A2U9CIH2_SCOMX|nr:Hypothetical protein SMAX5B_005291 [Scophthalmus maximus]KAF0032022.1 hypothetical protein F2P81_016577 [Scophthalmus maximus]